MKIIEPSAKYLDKLGKRPAEFIEYIGRTCYKSNNLITPTSADKFFDDILKRKHYAMTEHYWVHFIVRDASLRFFYNFLDSMAYQLFNWRLSDILKHIETSETREGVFVSMPLRVPLEWADRAREISNYNVPLLGALCNHKDPLFTKLFGDFVSTNNVEVYEEYEFIQLLKEAIEDEDKFNIEVKKHKTHTVLFVCDRGVSHELVRHRPCSFAQESTRYCNYSKDKFGNEITVIKPFFFGDEDSPLYQSWLMGVEEAEHAYFLLLAKGASPQEARSVLPNSLKTEIIVTANEVEWQHIINLRYHGTTGAPHPQMKEVMTLAYEELIKVGANIE